MVATARKAQAHPGIIDKAVVADVLKVLARHNPGLSKAALAAAGKVMTAVSAVAVRLPVEQQRRIAADDARLAQAVEEAVASLTEAPASTLIDLPLAKPVEVSRGAGLGAVLDGEEGARRLAAFATPARIEDWAGPVAGPGEIEKTLGIKRSTLHDWQKRGAVIGLLKGERKHVFPLAQFLDGRPVEGMAEVTRIIANPRVAWQWLLTPKPSLGGQPLERLKSGRLDAVLAAAMRDFG